MRCSHRNASPGVYRLWCLDCGADLGPLPKADMCAELDDGTGFLCVLDAGHNGLCDYMDVGA